MSLVNGSALLSTSALTTGSHSITVAYSGDSNYPATTSAVLTQQVSASSSSVTLTAPAGPLIGGRLHTLTASVSGTSPSGTVQFTDKGLVIAQATLVNGTASVNARLKGGDRVLKAVYLGDANNVAASSADVTRFVDMSNVLAPIIEMLLQ